MRTIDLYVDQAKEALGVKTDRQLALAMKISPAAISDFRTKKSWPSDDTMINLARIAGMDEQVALIELSFWRAAGEAKSTYEKILKRIVSFLPATLFGLAFMHPHAAEAAETAYKTISYLPPLPTPILAESVSSFATIMYITEKKTKTAFNKASIKQPFTVHHRKCVSGQNLAP